MDTQLNGIGSTVRVALRGMTGAQGLGLGALVTLLAFMIGWAIPPATAPISRTIVSLPEAFENRAHTLQVLEQIGIPYEFINGDILVEAHDYERAMRELAGKGIFTDWEIFARLHERVLSAPRGVIEKRWRLLLQRQLEMMLGSLQAINRASVLITPAFVGPKELVGGPARATVSVTVHPATGAPVTAETAADIVDMVWGALPYLKREHIFVVDESTSRRVPVPSNKETTYISDQLHHLERVMADLVKRDVHMVLELVLSEFAVAAVAEFKRETRREFEQQTEEEKSFVLKRVDFARKELLNVLGLPVTLGSLLHAKRPTEVKVDLSSPVGSVDASSTENETNSSFITTHRTWTPVSDLERISVSVMIKVDADKPLSDETLAELEAAVQWAASTYDDGRVKVAVIPLQ